LAFGRLAALDLTCSVVPLVVGIVAAALGAGYWALVAQQVFSGALMVVLLMWSCRWLPGAYDRGQPVAPIVRVGSSFFLGALLGYVMRNADAVVVGRRFGADALGLYNRSVQLVRTPLSQIQGPFGSVTLPVLAAARDDDERLVRATRRAQLAFIYPVLAGVAWLVAAASDVVRLTLGTGWIDAAPVMAWIAVAGGAGCVGYAAVWVLAARGLAARMNAFNILAAVLVLAGVLLGSRGGVEGVAAGVAIATALGWPLGLATLAWGGYLPVGALAWAAVRASATATLAGLAGWQALARIDPGPALVRAVLALVVVAAVMAAAATLPSVRRDYREVLGMLRMLRTKQV
ncbi:MAG: oligosaccharide flippase family protein, partial [Pseudonocardia sp.]